MITLRPISPDEIAAVAPLLTCAFGWAHDGPRITAWRRACEHLDLGNTLAAFHAGTLIGYVEYHPIEIQVGHGVLPGAYGTNLAVDSRWRRRKVAIRLMDRQLERLNDKGIAVYAGSVANVALMRSLGWEFGSTALRYDLHAEELADHLRHQTTSGQPEPLSANSVDDMGEVYARSVANRFGAFARTQSWWEDRILRDVIRQRPRAIVGWRSTVDRIDGYAVLEPHEDSTRIVELHALRHEAYIGLLQHLANVHHGSRLRWSAPADDPLPLITGQPYRLRPVFEPDKMFRIVNVGAVLNTALRAGRQDVQLTVTFHDEHASWNARTWRIERDHNGDTTTSTVDAGADLVVPVGQLAAMVGGLPSALPRADGANLCAVDLAGLLRPPAPAYCREDL